jgi:hypothetical protein
MPLAKDPEGGGTESDGSRSTMYCSYCYESGVFLQLDVTVDEMQVFVKKVLIEREVPAFLADFFVAGIPKLERWN